MSSDIVKKCVYTYQWINETKQDNLSFLRIYCISEDKKNICLRVKGFLRYVYVELHSKKASFGISQKAKSFGAIKTQLTNKHHLYYHNKDKTYPFEQCFFVTLKQMHAFIHALKYPVTIPSVGKHLYKVHETHASPILQLCSSRNLKMNGWITFTGIITSPDSQLTHCDEEYIVNYKKIFYNQDKCEPKIIPKVLSFDLEVNSENIRAMPSNKANDKIFQISCVFNDDRKILLTLPECQDLPGIEVRVYNSEKKLLLAFINLIKTEHPHVVMGYNILGFDIPYLIQRCERYLILENLERAGFNPSAQAPIKDVSWGSAACQNQHFKIIDWEGIILIDLLPIVKKSYKMDNYKLNTVANKFLGESKDPISVMDIFQSYRNKEVTNVGKYCIQDSKLVLDLFNFLQIWISFEEMVKVYYVRMIALYTQGQQIKIYAQVYKYCFDQNIVVDTDGYIADSNEKYRGAHVVEPVPGYYENIVPFDFSSLYPSLMQAYNICFSTAVIDPDVPDDLCTVFKWEDHVNCEHDPKIIKQEELKESIANLKTRQQTLRTFRTRVNNKTIPPSIQKTKSYNYTEYSKIKKEIYDKLKEYDHYIKDYIYQKQWGEVRYIISKQRELKKVFDEVDIEDYAIYTPTPSRVLVQEEKDKYTKEINEIGVELKNLRTLKNEMVKTPKDNKMCEKRYYRFYKTSVQKGVIPIILTTLLTNRNTIKAQMKVTKDPIKYIVLDKQQGAYKEAMNSMYGGMGAQRGYLVYMPGAMCVTMRGREAVQKSEKLLVEQYNATIVYGDTDSNYVQFPHIKTTEELWDHSVDIANKISSQFVSPMRLEFEAVIYRKFMLLSKKRYMWQNSGKDGVYDSKKIGKKGVLLARRDNSTFIKNIYEEIIRQMFNFISFEDIIFWLNINISKLFQKNVDIKDLIITKAVGDVSGSVNLENKTLGQYKVKQLPTDAGERKIALNGGTERDFYINSCPAQTILAEKMKKRGYPVEAGTRIEFVILKRPGAVKQGDQIEEFDYFKTHKNVLKVNNLYYLKSLNNPLDQLFKAAFAKDNVMSKIYKIRNNYEKMITELDNHFRPKVIFQ